MPVSGHAPPDPKADTLADSEEPEEPEGPEGLGSRIQWRNVHQRLFPSLSRRPSRLGRFVLLGRLGAGGMGEVFIAYDEDLDRRVAIKVLSNEASENPRARQRMVREARVLARLSHPNVVQVHEVGVHEEQVFIVMELIRGTDLRVWLTSTQPSTERSGHGEAVVLDSPAPSTTDAYADAAPRSARRSRREILDVFVQAGRGLAAAHAVGLVHRDFKPGNVMVGDDGRVRVLDFGLARVSAEAPIAVEAENEAENEAGRASPGGAERLTMTGSIMGTPAYMAPEQFAGGEADARTDQFGFCVALWEALYDQHPFGGGSLAALMVRVRGGELQLPSSDHVVPGWLHAVLVRGLASDPEERFESMGGLLEALLDDPDARRRRWLRWLSVVVMVAVAVAALIFGGLELRRRRRLEAREASARVELATLERQIEQARAASDGPRAERLFEAFVSRPELQGTEAVLDAWMFEAARRNEDGEPLRAQSAYARAYLLAEGGRREARILVALARGFHRRLDWGALTQVLAALDRRHSSDPVLAQLSPLRLDAALIDRDLPRARELLRDHDPDGLRLAALENLRGATPTALTSVSHVFPFDLEGDGEHQLLLRSKADPHLRIIRADPSLAEVATFEVSPGQTTAARGYPVPPGHGTPPLYVMESGDDVVLLELHPDGRWDERLRFPSSQPMMVEAGDLDSDGRAEIYVATGPYTRTLFQLDRDERGAWSWRAPVPSFEACRSDIERVIATDLDADGSQELVLGTGPWISYDLRVLRRRKEALRLVDRMQLGAIGDVAVVEAADGTMRMIASKTDDYESKAVFGSSRPGGEAEGLYVLALRDDHLQRLSYLPLPHPRGLDGEAHVRTIRSGDVDGNGLDDVYTTLDRDDGIHTLLLLQSTDGDFVPMLLGHMRPHRTVDLDSDGTDELLVEIEEDGVWRTWVLGMGEEALAPVSRPDLPAPRSLVDAADDPVVARTWERVTELERMGLFQDAAIALEDIAVASERDRSVARLRAAGLLERADDDERARELYERVARDPALALEGLRGALRSQLRTGHYEAALRTTEALLARSELTGSERAELVTLRARVDVGSRQTLDLRFDRALPPELEIHAPLALHRDPTEGVLELGTWSSELIASLPVTWGGGPLSIEAQWTTSRSEWGATVGLQLVPAEGGEPIVRLSEGAEGGEGSLTLFTWCAAKDGYGIVGSNPPGRSQPSTLRASLLPGLQERHCAVRDELDGRVDSGRTRATDGFPPPGEYRLELRAEVIEPARNEVRIRRLTATGLEIRATDGAAPAALTEARRTFVEGDYEGVLELLDGRSDEAPRVRALRAHALLQRGRMAEAMEVLTELVAGLEHETESTASLDALCMLLRREPTLYVPLLSSVMRADLAVLAHRAWGIALRYQGEHPEVQKELLALPLGSSTDPSSASSTAALVGLLQARADALSRIGRIDDAVEELRRALELSDGMSGTAAQAVRQSVELGLAALEMDRGQPSRARQRVRRVLADSTRPLYLEDRLRAHPTLFAVMAELE